LLRVDKLTLRFGGLTAVSEIDLQVREGEVAAVIGPNGAGKTSLFNAITGIYEPTSGQVALDGHDLREPVTRGLLVRQGLAGLLFGVLGLLSVANLDTLWLSVIKSQDPNTFSLPQAMTDAVDYLAARPRLETRMGKVWVVSADGSQQLATLPDRAAAETERQRWLERIANPDEPRARTLADEASRARWLRLLTFVVASLVGAAGAHAVWQRSRRTPQSVARRGIARTFQNIRLFHNMTVRENVLVAMDRHLRHAVAWWHPSRRGIVLESTAALLGIGMVSLGARRAGDESPTLAVAGLVLVLAAVGWGLAGLLRRGTFTQADQDIERRAAEEADQLLAFVGLRERADELARNLPYGDQRRLEIARALATRPRLLLLDEPAAGMNPSESVALMHLIRQIRERGVTVLLIEHHMRVVMGISDRITVLVHGKRVAEGTPEEIRHDPAVIEAYLGTDADAHG
jgi:ABC-type branched-subunit amino acid transport system ATPase component